MTGLTKPSGGGGEYEPLIRRIWATSVGSPGIQLPITMRPPGLVTRTISAAVSNGRGANIAPKIDHDEVERLVVETGEVRGVALLEGAVGEPELLGAVRAGGDQVRGDVDAPNGRAALGGGDGRGAVAAPEVEHGDAGVDADALDEVLAARPHRRRDPGEVALLPQRLVGIGRGGGVGGGGSAHGVS